MCGFVFLGLVLRITFLTASGSNTSITMFHKVSAGIPVNLTPASNEIIYASVLLCGTGVCFLKVLLIGTNVRLPNMHKMPHDVDSESVGITCKVGDLKKPAF